MIWNQLRDKKTGCFNQMIIPFLGAVQKLMQQANWSNRWESHMEKELCGLSVGIGMSVFAKTSKDSVEMILKPVLLL